MKTTRRRLLAALGAALAWPAWAQGAPHRVAFLEAGSLTANRHFLDALRSGLAEFGYDEGRNIVLDVGWAEGRSDRFEALLVELDGRKPDVIVVASTVGAVAAKKAGITRPVVFVGVSNPIAAGIVKSLAHPGGNMTGLSRGFGGIIGKALQVLKEAVPKAERTGILWNSVADVQTPHDEAEAASRTLGIKPFSFPVRGPADFGPAYAQMRKERIDSLLVITDPLTLRHRDAIVALSAEKRIPAMYEFAEFAEAGGLLAYSADMPALFARAALYVDKILRGANPGDLPVEQPTKFKLVINQRAAKALGLTIPQSLLVRADEVIT